jgi:sugar-specific transcriptional regulator TrmB
MRFKSHLKFLCCSLLLLLAASTTAAAQDSKRRKPTIDILIQQIAAQLDQMEQDRGNQFKAIRALYDDLNKAETENLNRNIGQARVAARLREAIASADAMIENPKEQTRAGALAGFLRRSVTRDQELFDAYVKQAAESRFSRERQIAKIKSEVTLIQAIRRDLEKLKKFPTDSERARFFLESAQTALDAITAANEKAAGQ